MNADFRMEEYDSLHFLCKSAHVEEGSPQEMSVARHLSHMKSLGCITQAQADELLALARRSKE